MGLADMTDPEAVLKAVAEFDELGRDAFLAKYGYGRALRHFVMHDGKRYDSKAIVGVAFGYENPSRGPLRSSDFEGGRVMVKRCLEKFGFKVRVQ